MTSVHERCMKNRTGKKANLPVVHLASCCSRCCPERPKVDPRTIHRAWSCVAVTLSGRGEIPKANLDVAVLFRVRFLLTTGKCVKMCLSDVVTRCGVVFPLPASVCNNNKEGVCSYVTEQAAAVGSGCTWWLGMKFDTHYQKKIVQWRIMLRSLCTVKFVFILLLLSAVTSVLLFLGLHALIRPLAL